MESSNEENSTKDHKPTTADFEGSYNNAEKMTNIDYDRRIEHGSEIVFSNNQYITPVSFEFSSEKKIVLFECLRQLQESIRRDENHRCIH